MEDDDQEQEKEITPHPDPHVYQPEDDEDEPEIDRRIRRAHERIRRLTIVGSPDIDISGSQDEGYAANKKPIGACCLDTGCKILTEHQCNQQGGRYIGNGTACTPNPCGCSITFSGITLCTGCIDGLSLGFGQSINNLIETYPINDTYELAPDIICSSVPALRGGLGVGNRINYDSWVLSPSCAGPPDSNENSPVSIFVRCVGGVWGIWMLDQSSLIMFSATGITNLSSIPNSISSGNCGSEVPDPCNDVSPATDLVIGYGGIARITGCRCLGA